jgi:hypothetical protein
MCVQVAVRKSLAERASTGQRVRQLENLTAEGKALADPEDDKLWLSLESKHRLLEFDYARTWEQVWVAQQHGLVHNVLIEQGASLSEGPWTLSVALCRQPPCLACHCQALLVLNNGCLISHQPANYLVLSVCC